MFDCMFKEEALFDVDWNAVNNDLVFKVVLFGVSACSPKVNISREYDSLFAAKEYGRMHKKIKKNKIIFTFHLLIALAIFNSIMSVSIIPAAASVVDSVAMTKKDVSLPAAVGMLVLIVSVHNTLLT